VVELLFYRTLRLIHKESLIPAEEWIIYRAVRED
jgi:hypothetical protein